MPPQTARVANPLTDHCGLGLIDNGASQTQIQLHSSHRLHPHAPLEPGCRRSSLCELKTCLLAISCKSPMWTFTQPHEITGDRGSPCPFGCCANAFSIVQTCNWWLKPRSLSVKLRLGACLSQHDEISLPMVPKGMLMSTWIVTGLANCLCCFAISAACCFLLLLVLLCCFSAACCCFFLFCAPVAVVFVVFSVVCAAFASVRAAFAAFAVAAVFGPPTVEKLTLAAFDLPKCLCCFCCLRCLCCCFSCLCCSPLLLLVLFFCFC